MHKNYLKKAFAAILSLSLAGANYAAGFGNGRFFRARPFQDEPEIPPEEFYKVLTKFISTSTSTAFNDQGKKVPLLSLFGPEKSTYNSCKKLFLDGNFSLFETQLETYFTIGNGFFVHTFLPYLSLHISDIEPANTSEECIAAFEDLQRSVAKKGFVLESSDKKGIGDFVLLAGWQGKNYALSTFDFVSGQLQVGVLFPTAKQCSPRQTCSLIPLGYEHSWAIPIITNGAVGLLDWITFGIRTETLFFFPRTGLVGIRQNSSEAGIIRLKRDHQARIREGTLYDVSIYLKADHFIKGLSLAVEFTHEHKRPSSVSSSRRTDLSLIDSDPILGSWTMNIFHINAEYDWSNEDNPFGPVVSFNYNRILSGRNIFNASTSVGQIAVQFRVDF